jgi:hypothetical protein
MRYLVSVLVIACIAVVMFAPVAARQDDDAACRAAYAQWRAAVEAHPQLGDPFWFDSHNQGPADLRKAVDNVVSYGPNLVPTLVEELRSEGDHMRVYRLLGLLRRVAGIDLNFDLKATTGQAHYWEAVPALKSRFLSKWDAGDYANATVILGAGWKDPGVGTDGSVSPENLGPLLQYGVFAVPFIADKLTRHESPVLFAAFLNVTDHMDEYTRFYKHPGNSFATGQEKAAFMKQWAHDNVHKFSRLKGLQDQIAALAAK